MESIAPSLLGLGDQSFCCPDTTTTESSSSVFSAWMDQLQSKCFLVDLFFKMNCTAPMKPRLGWLVLYHLQILPILISLVVPWEPLPVFNNFECGIRKVSLQVLSAWMALVWKSSDTITTTWNLAWLSFQYPSASLLPSQSSWNGLYHSNFSSETRLGYPSSSSDTTYLLSTVGSHDVKSPTSMDNQNGCIATFSLS
jgi:hypothetical protein